MTTTRALPGRTIALLKPALLAPEVPAAPPARRTNGEIPGWYYCQQARAGSPQVLLLTNLRGQKEERYLAAGRAQQKAGYEAQQQANPPASAVPDPRAHYPHFQSQALLADFARQFESAAVNRQRSAYEEANPPAPGKMRNWSGP